MLARTLALAARAVAAGVDWSRILIDAARDFGNNTWRSLEVTRRLAQLAATGWPTLVSVSNKDFGDAFDAPVKDRLTGTLATTALSAWLGARVLRARDVRQTRQLLDTFRVIHGDLAPARVVRGLA